jgi:hypothetical protein
MSYPYGKHTNITLNNNLCVVITCAVGSVFEVCMYVCMCIIINMLVKTIFNNKCCSIMNISQDNTVFLRSTFELRSAMLAESQCRTPGQLVTWRTAHEVFSLT